MDLTPRTHSDSIDIAATPQEVYAVVSDVTRTGEWSPTCRECRWEEGDGPRVGASFIGRNETPDRTWETRSEVVAAEPGSEFAWMVGKGFVRWSFAMRPTQGGGTELTQSWEFTSAGLTFFETTFGEGAARAAEDRTKAAHHDIPATLAAIKRILEGE
ncbi:SRPBCC family protein [Nocardioides insulae]|uniref:SRPBCC family protein n=1 Tax=Nocardioides insulae TaxID=394734 RepID=UPI0004038BAF|nr:SRPBCC family protein [Nocardioides insulae]